jgi:hypothetical protein
MIMLLRHVVIGALLLVAAAEASAQSLVLPQPVAGAQRGRVVLRAWPSGRLVYKNRYGQGITDTFANLVRDLVVIGVDQLNPKNAAADEPAAVLAKPQETFLSDEAVRCKEACDTLAALYSIRKELGMPDKPQPACVCPTSAGDFPPVNTGPPPGGTTPAPGQPPTPGQPPPGFDVIPTTPAGAAPNVPRQNPGARSP